jgi:hypothetical protein
MHRLSDKVTTEALRLLPQLRKQVNAELDKCGCIPATSFLIDERVLETLPHGAYEYIILTWHIEPKALTMDNVITVLDTKLFPELPQIIAHTLRTLSAVAPNGDTKRPSFLRRFIER